MSRCYEQLLKKVSGKVLPDQIAISSFSSFFSYHLAF
jgi:hypothetical protein